MHGTTIWEPWKVNFPDRLRKKIRIGRATQPVGEHVGEFLFFNQPLSAQAQGMHKPRSGHQGMNKDSYRWSPLVLAPGVRQGTPNAQREWVFLLFFFSPGSILSHIDGSGDGCGGSSSNSSRAHRRLQLCLKETFLFHQGSFAPRRMRKLLLLFCLSVLLPRGPQCGCDYENCLADCDN